MTAQIDTASLLDDGRVTLMGVPGSPYTRKMLALLRYRQIPYRLLLGSNVQGGEIAGLPQPKVSLLPTFFLCGANGALEAVTDSTPLIRRFEATYPARRAVPDDPALALIDALIEDFADEWCARRSLHLAQLCPPSPRDWTLRTVDGRGDDGLGATRQPWQHGPGHMGAAPEEVAHVRALAAAVRARHRSPR